MMNTKDFLTRILPEEGFYCGGAVVVNEDGSKKFKQRMFSNIQDLSDFLEIISGKGLDTYYAVSSFREKTSRKGDNVLATKILAFDIDVGKAANSYPDIKSALTALVTYINKSELPKPMIVRSGAGLHVYWLLTVPLQYTQWYPIAAALKQSAELSGLIIDPTVTSDAARVLRAVGTMHVKTGRTVTVLQDADPVPPEAFGEVAVTANLTRKRSTTLLDNLKVEREFPPASAPIIATKCQQIQRAIVSPDKVPEPLWYALIGVAAHTTDPEAAAVGWSKGHPNFNREDTLAKLEQWKKNAGGPALCSTFEASNPGGCKGCPFAGKVNSPIRLGTVYEEVEAVAPIKVKAPIMLPRPFKRTSAGIMITLNDVDVDVCPFDIYPISYGKDENLGYEVVRYLWNRPHMGWTELKFRQALLVDGHRDFAPEMADKGIILGSKKQTEIFQAMLRSYMQELQRNKEMIDHHASMGWKNEGKKFVIGSSIMFMDETGAVVEESTALSGHNRITDEMYGVAGDLNVWRECANTLQDQELYAHMFAIGVALSAPLYTYSGLKGITISLTGPTGSGKTLAQYWAQSVYGNPDRLHFSAKFTQNALFSRLGSYNNLPFTVDEATMLQEKDVGDFLYWVTQGRDKARLTRSTEERDAKTWATPVLVSTNVSLQAKLTAAGLETDAQMARLLELSVAAVDVFKTDTDAGHKLYSTLMNNYGHVGRAYLAKLIEFGPDNLTTLIDKARGTFAKRYGVTFTGQERFWEQALVLADLGLRLAKNLKLVDFDHTLAIKWAIDQVKDSRLAQIAGRADPVDILGEYLNAHSNMAVTAVHTGRSKAYVDPSRVPRNEMHIRYDLYRAKPDSPYDKGRLFIDRIHFRRWVAGQRIDYKSLMQQFEKLKMLDAIVEPRITISKDTPVKLPTVRTIAFDLTAPALGNILNSPELEAAPSSPIVLATKNGDRIESQT